MKIIMVDSDGNHLVSLEYDIKLVIKHGSILKDKDEQYIVISIIQIVHPYILLEGKIL